MNKSAVLKVCRGLGCCDGCCLRYLGVKNANTFKKDPNKFLIKYEAASPVSTDAEKQLESTDNVENSLQKDSETKILDSNNDLSKNVNKSDQDSNMLSSDSQEISNPDSFKDNEHLNSSLRSKSEANINSAQNSSESDSIEQNKSAVKQGNAQTANEVMDTEITAKSETKKFNNALDTNVKLPGENDTTGLSLPAKTATEECNNSVDTGKVLGESDTTTVLSAAKIPTGDCNDTVETDNKVPGVHDTVRASSGDCNDTMETDNKVPGSHDTVRSSSPAAKRMRGDVCVSCLGVLQPPVWEECTQRVREVLERKQYECETLACALSSPMAAMLRERAVVSCVREAVPDYSADMVTSLKEAWKWSFCCAMCERVGKTMDSGAVSPLLATFTMEYDHDLQELEILKSLAPAMFAERAQHRRRFAATFTRSAVEKALDGVSDAALQRVSGRVLARPGARARCGGVAVEHSPVYLGGRYIKLSRSLPQSPWVLQGRRVVEGSVQETIFGPLAALLRIPQEDIERRLKLIAAGREDVDVRCLGAGRPFAVEISDPRRQLSRDELSAVCEAAARGGAVVVRRLVYVTKEDLTRLKQGEETKCKTYEALCVKLEHAPADVRAGALPTDPISVTPEDLNTINRHRCSPEAAVVIHQKTPLRVLHRRPLLCRTREILDMHATPVPDHPQLFVLRLRTSAGTYVKEWCCGDLGRTTPALQDILQCRTDILALDVREVALRWPEL